MFNTLFRAVAMVGLMMSLTLAIPVAQAEIDEGIEYQLVKPRVPGNSADGKVEVVELFWYGCPHCYAFEPAVNQWKKDNQKRVDFVRIPAVFPNRPAWELHARAYYTADLLGVLDKIHGPLFDAIHQQRRRLFNLDELAAFFAQHGVKEDVFRETMYSFGVQMQLNRAKDLTERYGIDGVPTLVIDGQYRTHASLTNGQENMLKVTDFLVNKATNPGK